MKRSATLSYSVFWFFAFSWLGLPHQAQAQNRISFPKGESCKSFPAKTKGKYTFVIKIVPHDEDLLYLYSSQTDNIGEVTVRGSQGEIAPNDTRGYGIKETNQAYPISKTGDYRITLTTVSPLKKLTVCVIPNPNSEIQ